MKAQSTPLQTIHTLSGLSRRRRKGLGHPESACRCYKPGYRPPPAKCRYLPKKGRWVCSKSRRRKRRV